MRYDNDLPSVTEVISHFQPRENLDRWLKDNEEKSKRIGNRGTRVHAANHKYLLAKFQGQWDIYKSYYDSLDEEQKLYHDKTKGFLDLCTPVTYNNDLLLEKPLTYVGEYSFNGTPDNVSFVKGESLGIPGEYIPLVVDTKNVDRYKPDFYFKYYLQIAAYCALLNHYTNGVFRFNKGLVVTTTSRGLYYNYLDPDKILYFWDIFKSLLEAYHTKAQVDWVTKELNAMGYYNDDIIYYNQRHWDKKDFYYQGHRNMMGDRLKA